MKFINEAVAWSAGAVFLDAFLGYSMADDPENENLCLMPASQELMGAISIRMHPWESVRECQFAWAQGRDVIVTIDDSSRGRAVRDALLLGGANSVVLAGITESGEFVYEKSHQGRPLK